MHRRKLVGLALAGLASAAGVAMAPGRAARAGTTVTGDTVPSGAAPASPASVAFFGITLINTSLEPVTPAEEARRRAAEDQIVAAMTDSGRFTFVDTAPVAGRADLFANLAQCNGCDSGFARDLGADLAMTGEFQKTSNLILSFTLYLRDAQSGALIGGGSADIRGNTDDSWHRGVSYILRNRILK